MREDLQELWLGTRLLARAGGRTVDVDAEPAATLGSSIRPLELPVCLVTAYNPQAVPRPRRENRLANRLLRSALEAQRLPWLPAVGRAPDGTWAEPGFLTGGLSDTEAAAFAAEWDQLAVFMVTLDDVVVVAADGSQPCARPRLRAAIRAHMEAGGVRG